MPYSDPANSERQLADAPDLYRYVLEQPLASEPGRVWNYCGGATTLLTEAYRPEEKAKAQGMNDMLVFAVMGASSALSGAILYRLGWNALNLFALPLLLITGIAVTWLALHRRTQRSTPLAVPSIIE